MAKWVYERWQPKWPEATGGYRNTDPTLRVTTFDFWLSESNAPFSDLLIGDVFRAAGKYRQKTTSEGANEYEPGDTLPTPIKGTRLADVTLEEGTVPDDGVHTDNFWYVKVKKAFPTMRIMRDGQWAEVETGFVLKDGVWKPIEEIYKLQDGQWTQA